MSIFLKYHVNQKVFVESVQWQNNIYCHFQLAIMFPNYQLIWFIVIFGVLWPPSQSIIPFFFLTIVDDYTKFTWVHLMQHKSQTNSIIKAFFNLVQTLFKTKIKCLISDNGVEFQMKDYFSTQGTIPQLICVKTPQQNAIVERKHRHLLNVARTLRFQSHLPLTFWANCILIAAHIINIILTPFLSNKSSHELLYSVIPSYSHIKVFGCLAYVTTCMGKSII